MDFSKVHCTSCTPTRSTLRVYVFALLNKHLTIEQVFKIY